MLIITLVCQPYPCLHLMVSQSILFLFVQSFSLWISLFVYWVCRPLLLYFSELEGKSLNSRTNLLWQLRIIVLFICTHMYKFIQIFIKHTFSLKQTYIFWCSFSDINVMLIFVCFQFMMMASHCYILADVTCFGIKLTKGM